MKRVYIAVAIPCLATAAVGQIPRKSEKPAQKARVFVPNTTEDAGAVVPKRPTPAPSDGQRAIAKSWDRKSWISSIDGKTGGIIYSLGSEHVIRGGNLDGFVLGRIGSERMPDGRKYQPVASMLTLVRQTSTELVVRVTQVSGGKLPWSASEHWQGPLRLKMRIAGGARDIDLLHDRNTHYRCTAGEPNCAP